MTGAETPIDTAELAASLSSRLDAAVTDAEVIHDGLNLSVAISTEDEERAYVLRRPNELRDTASFIDVRREHEVLKRLRDTAVPAPEPVLVCEDESVVGDPFLVMTHLDGETVPLGSALPERFRHPSARERVATGLIETLADLHSVPGEQFADVCDRHTPRDQLESDVARLDAATAVTGHEPPAIRGVVDWLRENVPAEPAFAPVHGDYRPGNVLFAGADEPEISGVLDWETAFLGDPLTELGYLLLRWRDDGDPTPSLDGIEARHANDDAIRQLRARNRHGLAPFTNEPGSLSRRELVARYEEKTGLTFENWRFYLAFSAFMLAAVWADLHRLRVEAGAESDWEPHVEYMALLAHSMAEGEFEL